MQLRDALRLEETGVWQKSWRAGDWEPSTRFPAARLPAAVAIVGAGGKTTALFQLARSFLTPVIVTTSTHIGTWQAAFADQHIVITRPEDVETIAGQIEGVTLVTGPAAANDRLGGLDAPTLEAVKRLSIQSRFPVLVEADGARQRALKAPAAHEPVIPDWVDTILVVAGLSELNHRLDEQAVHRLDLFATISMTQPGDMITIDSLSRVLTSPQGGLKNILPGMQRVALLNQADTSTLVEKGSNLAKALVPFYNAVLVASLKDRQVHEINEPAAGIILAAGGSSRFGQPKMLLPWRGKPLVRFSVEAALEAGLAEVVVVTGAAGDEVRRALEDLPVRFVENRQWQSGQSSSVRAGLTALSSHIRSTIFFLADQPFIQSDLVKALIKKHAKTLSPVVAPRVLGKRGNPVLFDQVTFADLMLLQGDTGGRAIIDRYSSDYLDWDDETILQDIDSPDDYDRLCGQR